MSINAQGLVGSVRNRGAFLSVKGDKLLVINPGALDAETVDRLRRYKAEVIAVLCCVPDCGALGSRTDLGDGKYSILCSTHVDELKRRVRATSGPAACKECSTLIPGSSSLCADCGAKQSRLVAFALQLGATQAPFEEPGSHD